MTTIELARLVHQLRLAQKKSGAGYKTPAGRDEAAALEQQVDHAVHRVLHGHHHGHPHPPDRGS